MEKIKKFLGIDIGVKKVAFVILAGDILKSLFIISCDKLFYDGNIQIALDFIKQHADVTGSDKIVVTGVMRQKLISLLCRNKICSSSKLMDIVLNNACVEALNDKYPEGDLNYLNLGMSSYMLATRKDGKFSFYRNTRCSSGTGQGIEMFLSPYGLDMINVGELVKNVQTDVVINTRCPVMSKSDRVHLSNEGMPKEEVILAFLRCVGCYIGGWTKKNIVNGLFLFGGGVAHIDIIRNSILSCMNIEHAEIVNGGFLFEACGAALVAAKNVDSHYLSVFRSNRQIQEIDKPKLRPLSCYLDKITYCQGSQISDCLHVADIILSIDLGSTGTKAILQDIKTGSITYSRYENTGGDPIGAVKKIVRDIISKSISNSIVALVFTGSGRYSAERVARAIFPHLKNNIFVENEVIAHITAAYSAMGREIFTMFDLGGQDSKYGKVVGGILVDQALNLVCSAGTGSFLEELLRQFSKKDIDLDEFGKMALTATNPLDFGERCTVFFLGNALLAHKNGAELADIFAGAYYAVVQNFVRAVVAGREIVGDIVLQGTPAVLEALPTAFAAVTGRDVIVPVNPGMAGARGAAIRIINAHKSKLLEAKDFFDIKYFLDAGIISKKSTLCQDAKCGGKCNLEKTIIEAKGKKITVVSNGLCPKYEGSSQGNKLPIDAPNPYKEREKVFSKFISNSYSLGFKMIGVPYSLSMTRYAIFFVKLLGYLGFDVILLKPNQTTLEKGNNLCRSSELCAPIKLVHGLDYSNLDAVFLPKIGSLFVDALGDKVTCPMAQTLPNMISNVNNGPVLNPILQFDKGLDNPGNIGELLKSLRQIIPGLDKAQIESALTVACTAQNEFEEQCQEIGKNAIAYSILHKVPIALLLGRSYILYEPIMNSGISEEFQRAGTIALPIDCLPKDILDKAPLLDLYWGEAQLNLRAAVAVSKSDLSIYPVWLSCFACGPDSFVEHFLQKLMTGYLFSNYQVDGLVGSAGYKTRVEATAIMIREYYGNKFINPDVNFLVRKSSSFQRAHLILSPMSEGNRLLAAVFNSRGISAEALPLIDAGTFALGRQHCTGKECAPCMAVIGSVLKYLQDQSEDVAVNVFLPGTNGPCRFGAYQQLMQIVLNKEGYNNVGIYSLNSSSGYQNGLDKLLRLKLWSAICVNDLLTRMLHYIRPIVDDHNAVDEWYQKCLTAAEQLLAQGNHGDNIWNILGSWGLLLFLKNAVNGFKSFTINPDKKKAIIDVSVVGEIYVRSEPWLNGYIIREMEQRGLRANLAYVSEWMNYTSYVAKESRVAKFARNIISNSLHKVCATQFGWHPEYPIKHIVQAGLPYIGETPHGEAILTVGSVLLHKRPYISLAPVGCMPGRASECQLSGCDIPGLSIYVDGGPLDLDVLDAFAYQVHSN
ncbi:MAG: acyl-CoA dehydratase activase-related protein [bacterium]